MCVAPNFVRATLKIPAKYVANEFVMIVIMMKNHSSDLVIIAAKACAGHVEIIAYVGNVIRFTAHYVQKMTEWMLLSIVKVKNVQMDPFARDAECLAKTPTAWDVRLWFIQSYLGRMKGLLGRREPLLRRIVNCTKR